MAEETANIYRVNKLLELEAADWQRQLEKAVGGFKSDPPFPFLLWTRIVTSLIVVGFL